MVSGELVVVGAGEFVDESFEARSSLEIDELPTFEADKVVMMGFKGLSKLVALFEADLNHVDDTELGKELQGPIDACTLGELARFDKFP